MSKCRSCGAKILWAEVVGSRKLIPLDPEPSERGNVKVEQSWAGIPRAKTFGSLEALELRDAGHELYVAHHATCPDADAWRRKK